MDSFDIIFYAKLRDMFAPFDFHSFSQMLMPREKFTTKVRFVSDTEPLTEDQ